jgi:Kef-type K+ transport system membrane component KefB
VLFFVFIGARLNVAAVPPWIWGLVAAYVVFRTAGKYLGIYCGAKMTGAPAAMRNYGGLALFTQGGVAVGLSIMASGHLNNVMLTGDLSLGDTIIFTVTATTLAVQLLGPPMAKLAALKAGETGRNITREDIFAS